jgi:hypothetical protein
VSTFTDTRTTEYRVVTCYLCAEPFGMTAGDYTRRKEDHDEFWYCPKGHRQHFVGETNLQRETRLRQEAEARVQRMREDAARERASLMGTVTYHKRQAAAAKGAATKIRKRVAHGVCPCCNRTFRQLAAHMAAKHPEYVEGGAA